MHASTPLAAALVLALASFAATAQTAAEHAQHHPAAAPPTAPVAPGPPMSDMDRHLQLMRDMSRKMAEARTPEERQALMAEHRQAMQDGMKMMGQMM